MNKALVTAMLLGLAAADTADEDAFKALRDKRGEKAPTAEDCEDAATATARAAKARAEGEKALLATEKKRLDDLLVAETKIYEEMKGRSDTAAPLTEKARGYLDVAQQAFDAATKIKADNDAIREAEKAPILALEQAKGKADTAVIDAKKLVTDITAEIVDLEAAVVQHAQEVIDLTALWKAKDDAKKAVTQSIADKTEEKAKRIEERDGCASDCKTKVQDGSEKVEDDAIQAETDAQKLVDDYKLANPNQSEADLFTTLKTENKKKVKLTAYKKSKDDACAAITGGSCNDGDQVKELDAAVWGVSSFTDYTTAKNNHDSAVTALSKLKAKLLIATRDKGVAIAANTAKKQEVTDLETAIGADDTSGLKKDEKDAAALVTAPLEAKEAVEKQSANAVIERDAAKARKVKLEASLAALEVVAANAADAHTKGQAADLAAKAKSEAATIEINRLTPYLEAAKKAGTRASAFFKFYNDYTVDCKTRVDDITAQIAAIANTVKDNGSAGTMELADNVIAKKEEDVQAAITRCKRRQYSDAIAALTKFNEDEAAATKKNEETKAAYDEKRKKAIAAKVDCRKNADGVRAECGEEECCGQANRYDRDGTRMTVEVCGTADESTYTYWPVMKTGMAKAPQTEQWRYYCIGGAKNLAAGAAAIAGAIYMQS